MPSGNLLDDADPTELFHTAGVLDQVFISDLPKILRTLVSTASTAVSFPLTYFDLFVHGLTNIARTIYYGTDVILNAVEFNLEASNSSVGWMIGEHEQDFAFGFVRFMLAQNLAHIDYADCLIDWVDREMQPHFVAPLTSRGRSLVSLIHAEEQRLVASGMLPDENGRHVAQEGFFEIKLESYHARFPRIRRFQEVLKEEPT